MNRRRLLACAFLSVISIGWFGRNLPNASAQQSQRPETITLHVKNMHCEGCAKRLRARLYKLPHVLKVTTNVKSGVAVLTPTKGKSIAAKGLWEVAEAEKFQVAKVTNSHGTTFHKKPKS